MKQKEYSRNKSTYLWSNDFQQNYQSNSPEKELSLQKMVVEQLAIHMLRKQKISQPSTLDLDIINEKVQNFYRKTWGRKTLEHLVQMLENLI